MKMFAYIVMCAATMTALVLAAGPFFDRWCVENAATNPIAASELCDGNQCRLVRK